MKELIYGMSAIILNNCLRLLLIKNVVANDRSKEKIYWFWWFKSDGGLNLLLAERKSTVYSFPYWFKNGKGAQTHVISQIRIKYELHI